MSFADLFGPLTESGAWAPASVGGFWLCTRVVVRIRRRPRGGRLLPRLATSLSIAGCLASFPTPARARERWPVPPTSPRLSPAAPPWLETDGSPPPPPFVSAGGGVTAPADVVAGSTRVVIGNKAVDHRPHRSGAPLVHPAPGSRAARLVHPAIHGARVTSGVNARHGDKDGGSRAGDALEPDREASPPVRASNDLDTRPTAGSVDAYDGSRYARPAPWRDRDRLFPRAREAVESGRSVMPNRAFLDAIARHPAGRTLADRDDCPTIHRVTEGDNLWSIAAENLGTDDVAAIAAHWKLIYEMNRSVISNPHQIFPGQVLRLPKSCRG